MKCQKCVRHAPLNFLEPNVTSSDCSFPNSSPKHKDTSFMSINDTEKQHILTVKRLNQQFFVLFNVEND